MNGKVAPALAAEAVNPATQPAAVGPRIGKAINVVDAQAIDEPGFDQLEDLAVGGFEDLGMFCPQADQLVDIKEAPPVDVIVGGTPAGQAVVLLIQEGMQAQAVLR